MHDLVGVSWSDRLFGRFWRRWVGCFPGGSCVGDGLRYRGCANVLVRCHTYGGCGGMVIKTCAECTLDRQSKHAPWKTGRAAWLVIRAHSRSLCLARKPGAGIKA